MAGKRRPTDPPKRSYRKGGTGGRQSDKKLVICDCGGQDKNCRKCMGSGTYWEKK